MAYKTSDNIYIRTNYRGYITPLGMSGPVVIPLKCDVATVMKLVMGGMEVFQVNPDTQYSVLLTLSNILDDTKIYPKPQVDPFNVGKATTVTETKGVVPPTRPVTPPPLVSETVTGSAENQASDENEAEDNAEELKSEENELVQQATNQHLTKAQKRRLRQMQQQAAQAETAHAVETNTTEEADSSDEESTPTEE